MSSDPSFQRFREISWRRALTGAEQAELDAWLKANPQFRQEWEAEASLSSSLARVPNPAVPSNFTARVLQAIERETLAEPRSRAASGWWQNLLRRTRWAMGSSFAVLLVITGFLIHGHRVERQHELALMKSVAIVAGVSALPNTEVLTNFDTIRALSQAPAPDDQLLAALE